MLVSKCEKSYSGLSKELFTEIANNAKVLTDTEVIPDSHKIVQFASYIRTSTDNLVLLMDEDCFAMITPPPTYMLGVNMYPTYLIDSGMLCGKVLIDSAFHFKTDEALLRAVTHSSCFPVGAIETKFSYVLVFNVVISPDLLKDEDVTLNKGFFFNPIESFSTKDNLQRLIAESLVLVKSEGENNG